MKFRTYAMPAVMLLALAVPAMAQRGPGRGPGAQQPGPRAHGVEAALRLKEELKLTDAQVSQLEALRKEIVATQQANSQHMIDVRSRIAAGELQREDARKEMASKREAMQAVAKQRREKFEQILTKEQLDQLHEKMRAQGRHRMDGRGGPGFGGGPRRGPGTAN